MRSTDVSEKQISSVIEALSEKGIAEDSLNSDEFYTIAYIQDSDDGVGLTSLLSPHHFRTIKSLAAYIVADLISDDGYTKITDDVIKTWVSDCILSDEETETPGNYVVFVDGLTYSYID